MRRVRLGRIRWGQLIATTDNISLHPAGPLGNRSSRAAGFNFAAATRACRSYFDWHPITGGFALLMVCALAVTAFSTLLEAVVPTTGGWAICTPLNGAMLAVLLMSRRKLWPFLILGYVLALSEGTALAGTARHRDLLEVFGNVFELFLAAFTLPPYRNLKQWLQEPRLLGAFTGYALILGPAVISLTVARRAAGGATAVCGLQAGFQADFWQRARIAGIVGSSEALGIALGTSLVLVLCNRQTWHLFRWRALPATLGLFALLGLTTWFTFGPFASTETAIYMPYAVLIGIAFFLGLRGAVLGTAIFGASLSVLSAHSSFAPDSGQAQLAKSCIALAVLTIFPLGVTLFNRAELELRLKDHQAELDKLKSLDRLTGVANRKRFDLVLAREWQRAIRDPKSIALLMIDTDFFDLYNEYYGPQAGDECLRLIASKLSRQPHRPYDLLSRFDGGRFSVLLPGAAKDAIERIAEEFRAEIAALELPHEPSQFNRVTVSVGWASMLPETGLEPGLLIAAADAALASAKSKGKNRVEGFISPAAKAAAAAN